MAISKLVVASLVKRIIKVPVLGADKKTSKLDPVTKTPLVKDEAVAVEAKEVLDFKVDGNQLTVATTDGKKLTALLTDEQVAGLDPEKVAAEKASKAAK